ncbi:hypothetical protein GCM10027445_44000 [Amycolatopsis endophytica]
MPARRRTALCPPSQPASHPRPRRRGVRGEVGIGPVHEIGIEDHSGEVPGEPRRVHAPVHLPLHRFDGGQQTAAIERLGSRTPFYLRTVFVSTQSDSVNPHERRAARNRPPDPPPSTRTW